MLRETTRLTFGRKWPLSLVSSGPIAETASLEAQRAPEPPAAPSDAPLRPFVDGGALAVGRRGDHGRAGAGDRPAGATDTVSVVVGTSEDLFWSKVDVTGVRPSDCWLWTGSVRTSGYGRSSTP